MFSIDILLKVKALFLFKKEIYLLFFILGIYKLFLYMI